MPAFYLRLLAVPVFGAEINYDFSSVPEVVHDRADKATGVYGFILACVGGPNGRWNYSNRFYDNPVLATMVCQTIAHYFSHHSQNIQ